MSSNITLRKVYRIPAIAFALAVCAIATVSTSPAQAQVFGLSEQEEIRAGQEVAAQAEKEYGGALPANHPMSLRVRAIGEQFARLSERKNIPYTYKVLNNDEVLNAFAAPGGPIYVTRKLVNTTTNDAELAYVLGHETGHIDRKHIVKQVEKQQKAGIIAGILGAIIGEGRAGDIVGTIANIGWTVIQRGYSRDDENESDTVGVRWMSQLGYDPNAAISMLGKLGDGRGGGLDKYLSTHPAPQDRQQRVQELIRTENLTEVARRNGGPRLSANLPTSYYSTTGSIAGYPSYPTGYPGYPTTDPYGTTGNYNYGVGIRGTVTATVTRDLGNNQFEVRADDNRVFAVRLAGTPSRRLYAGERVQLTGSMDTNNVFIADRLEILPNNDPGYYGNNGTYNGTYDDGTYNPNVGARGVMTATVIRDLGVNQFEVRDDDDNRIYLVRLPTTLSRRFYVGERVQMTGTVTANNVFEAESVRLLTANDPGYYPNTGTHNDTATNGRSVRQRITMLGTVTRDLNGKRFEVRADNNNVYTVRSRQGEPRQMRVGDRVELTGYLNNRNIFVAESVRLLTGTGAVVGGIYPSINGQAVDFIGTVERTQRSILQVRGDNGQLYQVRRPGNPTDNFHFGERVRIVGAYTNEVVVATSINRY